MFIHHTTKTCVSMFAAQAHGQASAHCNCKRIVTNHNSLTVHRKFSGDSNGCCCCSRGNYLSDPSRKINRAKFALRARDVATRVRWTKARRARVKREGRKKGEGERKRVRSLRWRMDAGLARVQIRRVHWPLGFRVRLLVAIATPPNSPLISPPPFLLPPPPHVPPYVLLASVLFEITGGDVHHPSRLSPIVFFSPTHERWPTPRELYLRELFRGLLRGSFNWVLRLTLLCNLKFFRELCLFDYFYKREIQAQHDCLIWDVIFKKEIVGR